MVTYLGYFRFNRDFLRAQSEEAQRTGNPPDSETMRQKVVGIRGALPDTIKLIASYNPIRSAASVDEERHPRIWVVETDDPQELQFVNQWYAGFLDFEWVPAVALGTSTEGIGEDMERVEATREAASR